MTKIKCSKCSGLDVMHYIQSPEKEPEAITMEDFQKNPYGAQTMNLVLVYKNHVLHCRSCQYTITFTAQ